MIDLQAFAAQLWAVHDVISAAEQAFAEAGKLNTVIPGRLAMTPGNIIKALYDSIFTAAVRRKPLPPTEYYDVDHLRRAAQHYDPVVAAHIERLSSLEGVFWPGLTRAINGYPDAELDERDRAKLAAIPCQDSFTTQLAAS